MSCEPSFDKRAVKQSPTSETSVLSAEGELDRLISSVQERRMKERLGAVVDVPDRIERLRKLTIEDLIPVFVELKEKYAASQIIMEMDASNFLQGGREIKFQFQIGDYRTELAGTVTTEAIAFYETRFAPDMNGELASGPMLRLHRLNANTFREFICERLAVLMRTVIRWR